MSPDRLGTALSDLVDDVEQGMAPPAVETLWAGGRRRRRTARLVPVLAAACAAALVALVVWPSGTPRASVPADGGRLTSYPAVIPKPPFVTNTGRPGLTAAVVASYGDSVQLYAASPGGVVTHLVLPDAYTGTSTQPALSPDGRWLARGFVLTDLVRGVTLPSQTVRQGLEARRMPAEGTGWWSPDSRRVYVDSTNQGRITSSGLVIATDGTITQAPLFAGGRVPVVAGWLDDDTVLAFVDVGEPGEMRLEGRTWRVGEPAWRVSAPDLEPRADGEVFDQSGLVQAGLSPDRTQVLLTEGVTDPTTSQVTSTRATVYDARTGARLGIADLDVTADGAGAARYDSVTWDGWGCRPVWHEGLPVITDQPIRTITPVVGGGPVSVSTRYGTSCVAFAGNELRGAPAQDSSQVVAERIWVWGGRLLVLIGLGTVIWWFTRRRGWRQGSRAPGPPFLPSRG